VFPAFGSISVSTLNLILRACDAISDLILRRREAPSRRMAANSMAAWFETHGVAVLLTMRVWHALILRSIA
jgi:hypothetical protein